MDLQQRLGLAYVFIAHDLAVVKHIAAPRGRHVPRPHRRVRVRASAVRAAAPSVHAGAAFGDSGARARRTGAADDIARRRAEPDRPPSGCRFRTRCPYAQALCAAETPPLVADGGMRSPAISGATSPRPPLGRRRRPAERRSAADEAATSLPRGLSIGRNERISAKIGRRVDRQIFSNGDRSKR